MTDRELLEAAAKAAGIELDFWNDGKEPYSSGEGFILSGSAGRFWNPLTRDGDALRLAVKLHLTIDITPWATDCGPWDKYTSSGGATDAYESRDGDHDGDHHAATRRAIVRAASALSPQEQA